MSLSVLLLAIGVATGSSKRLVSDVVKETSNGNVGNVIKQDQASSRDEGLDDGTHEQCMCQPSGLGAGRGVLTSHRRYMKNLLQAVEENGKWSKLAPFFCEAGYDKCSDCVIGKQPCCTVSTENGVDKPVGCGEHKFAIQKYKNMQCSCGLGVRQNFFKSNIAKGAGIAANPTCTPDALCSQCCSGGEKKVCVLRYEDEEGGMKGCPRTKAQQDAWDVENEVQRLERAPIVTKETAKAAEPSSVSTPSVSSDHKPKPGPAHESEPAENTGEQWAGKSWKDAARERAERETGVSYVASGEPAAPSTSSSDTGDTAAAAPAKPLTRVQRMQQRFETGKDDDGKSIQWGGK